MTINMHSAQLIFNKIKLETNDEELKWTAYYDASSAIRLNHANADDKMESFVTNFPTSAKSNQAYIEVALLLSRKLSASTTMVSKVNENQLSTDDRISLISKRNMHFLVKNKKEATKY
jgi:hypothetical protein